MFEENCNNIYMFYYSTLGFFLYGLDTLCGVRQVYAHEFVRKEKTVNYDI